MGAAAHYSGAASTDSFITSPSEPVRKMVPLPGMVAASTVKRITPDFGPGQTHHLAHVVVFFRVARNFCTPR